MKMAIFKLDKGSESFFLASALPILPVFLPSLNPSPFKVWKGVFNKNLPDQSDITATPVSLCENGKTDWKVELVNRSARVHIHVKLNRQFSDKDFIAGSQIKTLLLKELERQKPQVKKLFRVDETRVVYVLKYLPNGEIYYAYEPKDKSNKQHWKAALEANQHNGDVTIKTGTGLAKGITKAGINFVKSTVSFAWSATGRYALNEWLHDKQGQQENAEFRDGITAFARQAKHKPLETTNAVFVQPISKPLARIPGQIERQEYEASGESLGEASFNAYVSVKGGVATAKTVDKLGKAMSWSQMNRLERKSVLLQMPNAKGLSTEAVDILTSRKFIMANDIKKSLKSPPQGAGERQFIHSDPPPEKQLTPLEQFKPDGDKLWAENHRAQPSKKNTNKILATGNATLYEQGPTFPLSKIGKFRGQGLNKKVYEVKGTKGDPYVIAFDRKIIDFPTDIHDEVQALNKVKQQGFPTIDHSSTIMLEAGKGFIFNVKAFFNPVLRSKRGMLMQALPKGTVNSNHWKNMSQAQWEKTVNQNTLDSLKLVRDSYIKNNSRIVDAQYELLPSGHVVVSDPVFVGKPVNWKEIRFLNIHINQIKRDLVRINQHGRSQSLKRVSLP